MASMLCNDFLLCVTNYLTISSSLFNHPAWLSPQLLNVKVVPALVA